MDTYIRGTKISLTNPESVLKNIKDYDYKSTSFISLFGLYPLSKSFENKELRYVLNQSFINPLHGKSIEFYLKLMGKRNIKAVDGVFLLENLLKEPVSHYFYGANEETLKKIKNRINNEFPDAIINGFKEPPYVNIDTIENQEQIKNDFIEINKSKPQIVWIGLGGIKQDYLMFHYSKYLDQSLLIGVGAVFDYFGGNLSLSSKFTKNIGLRWLQRLIQQPYLIKKKLSIIKTLLSIPYKRRDK